MRRRRRRADPIHLSSLVEDGLEGLVGKTRALELRARRAWPEAVGPAIAARTKATSLSRGVLKVSVSSAAWLNELTYLRDDILKRLQNQFGRETIREIHFVADGRSPR